MSTQQIKVRLMMDVSYSAPVSVSAEEVREHLYRGTESAIQSGLLTDRGDVEVDEYSMDVVIVDDGLPEPVQLFKNSIETHAPILDGLVANYRAVLKQRGPAPGLDAFILEHVDSLEADLCSRAANGCLDDEDAQEAAISAVESWVSDNVRHDAASRIAAVLWGKGVYAGTVELLRWLQ